MLILQIHTKARASRGLRRCAFIVLILVFAAVGMHITGPNRTEPIDETEIFNGVHYGCHTLPNTAEGEGPVHWARIDLTAPGIELYVTPTDPLLASEGYQYRLKRLGPVVQAEHLAIAVNGSLFTKEPSRLSGYWSGQRASGVETVVSEGRVSHSWEHTYLLWFNAELTPTLERRKPPPKSSLNNAKWGIGGQGVGLADGVVERGQSDALASRTAIGIDPQRRLLFLATFQSASARSAMQELATLGARDAILVDGGGSTAMAIGQGATGVRPGVVIGGWRPVATHFGVRAKRKEN